MNAKVLVTLKSINLNNFFKQALNTLITVSMSCTPVQSWKVWAGLKDLGETCEEKSQGFG